MSFIGTDKGRPSAYVMALWSSNPVSIWCVRHEGKQCAHLQPQPGGGLGISSMWGSRLWKLEADLLALAAPSRFMHNSPKWMEQAHWGQALARFPWFIKCALCLISMAL